MKSLIFCTSCKSFCKSLICGWRRSSKTIEQLQINNDKLCEQLSTIGQLQKANENLSTDLETKHAAICSRLNEITIESRKTGEEINNKLCEQLSTTMSPIIEKQKEIENKLQNDNANLSAGLETKHEAICTKLNEITTESKKTKK